MDQRGLELKRGRRVFDLIVTGGLAVTPGASQAADIGVAGHKIAAIGAPRSPASAGAARTIDASGQIVVPGGVDPHIHCSSPIPFPGGNEDLLSAAPEQVSRAALHGGTTPFSISPPCPPDQPLPQSIESRQREWAGSCYCDYGFHLLLHGKLDPAERDQ
jgi:dihydropyrimidinase